MRSLQEAEDNNYSICEMKLQRQDKQQNRETQTSTKITFKQQQQGSTKKQLNI